ncbi:MAG: hypothetical protein Q7S33_04355 [Nanoarchaeota archaeon]|nr:hypothetical protein [Nanoarchaeota archaeon]
MNNKPKIFIYDWKGKNYFDNLAKKSEINLDKIVEIIMVKNLEDLKKANLDECSGIVMHSIYFDPHNNLKNYISILKDKNIPLVLESSTEGFNKIYREGIELYDLDYSNLHILNVGEFIPRINEIFLK